MLLGSLFVVVLSACSTLVPPTLEDRALDTGRPGEHHVLDVSRLLVDEWTELQFKGRTEFYVTVWNDTPVLKAVGRNSASGLIRQVDVNVDRCPNIRWSWRVNALQSSADLRTKSKEDVAASLFLLFGDPGMLFAPNPVPTLRYVWASDTTTPGEVIDSPYMPGVVKSLVVRAGPSQLGQWLTETRNVKQDYQKVFGPARTLRIHALALFTDNDQTREPVEALYGPISVICSSSGSDPVSSRGATRWPWLPEES